jgi:hypothetical protein
MVMIVRVTVVVRVIMVVRVIVILRMIVIVRVIMVDGMIVIVKAIVLGGPRLRLVGWGHGNTSDTGVATVSRND